MIGFYVIKQYERGVQFRLGRVKEGPRGPGVIFVIPLVDRVHRVSLRIVTLPIESQGIITRDNVSVGVSAVAYYRVEDAVRSIKRSAPMRIAKLASPIPIATKSMI